MLGSHPCLNLVKHLLGIYTDKFTIATDSPVLVSQSDIVGKISLFQCCAKFVLAAVSIWLRKKGCFNAVFPMLCILQINKLKFPELSEIIIRKLSNYEI